MSGLDSSHAEYLFQAVRNGTAMLLLGAGASANSTNRWGKPIKLGSQLAEAICARSGLAYADESLPDVVQAVVGSVISDEQFFEIIRGEYTSCNPSADLRQLFSYPWARAYTLNVDDSVDRLGQMGDGRYITAYNGLIDRVVPQTATADLQLIHLNGQAGKPEHGLVFSHDEYAKRLTTRNPWYEELAADYVRFTPVIIGSKLNEPLLWTELERVKERGSRLGMAFLIVPGNTSDIQKLIFDSRNIHHVAMTMNEFASTIRRNCGLSVKAADVVKEVHIGIKETTVLTLSKHDIETAMALRPVVPSEIRRRVIQNAGDQWGKTAQFFLQGAPPTWQIAISDVSVDLQAGRDFVPTLRSAISGGTHLVVILGMAGAGKSTLAMRSVLHLAETAGFVVYELDGDAKNFSGVFELLKRLHPDKQVILYLSDLFLYGDQLSVDLEEAKGSNITLVSSARLSEWRQRFNRYLGSVATTFELKRFDKADYSPLIDRLLRYVPAPSFVRANPAERLKRFENSRSQLLIALREVTESKKFDEIIEDEWAKIIGSEARWIFYIAGTSTVARVGISKYHAQGIYLSRFDGASRKFGDVLKELDGIVLIGRDGRLRVRHEVYAEHIFRIEPLSAFLDAVRAILTALSRYEVPLTIRLTKNDSALFKWLLSARSLFQRCNARGTPAEGLSIYEHFEKTFELDGHFWLQYGLYCRKLGQDESAIEYLNKSIQAYPGNSFAIHALADLKLRVAVRESVSTSVAAKYIGEAVEDLLGLDARQDSKSDLYPIATLGTRHIAALLRLGREAEARAAAQRYFDRVQQLMRSASSAKLARLRNSLLAYASTGIWNPASFAEMPWD